MSAVGVGSRMKKKQGHFFLIYTMAALIGVGLLIAGQQIYRDRVREKHDRAYLEAAASALEARGTQCGLRDVEVVYDPDSRSYWRVQRMTVRCSNLNDISYGQILWIEQELNDVIPDRRDYDTDLGILLEDFVCGEDVYTVYHYSRSLYKNDRWVYDDPFAYPTPTTGSEAEKPAQPKQESGTSRRPYVPPAREADPYDAADFSSPEDFYDEHYDDFFSYEDAETYWQEYGD